MRECTPTTWWSSAPGPVGENVADRARAAGLCTAVVESELVGGECSYWACMPSKALLRPVIARADARRLPGLRQAVQGPLDAAAVLARRDEYTSHWKDDGQVGWLDAIGADLYRGHGRLAGPRRSTVDGPDGRARPDRPARRRGLHRHAAPRSPTSPAWPTSEPWTSREATSAQEVPGRLVVVGGGVVAVEMATAWQALGSQVTLLVRGSGLLPRMEPFAGELVAAGARRGGRGGADRRLRRPRCARERRHRSSSPWTDGGERSRPTRSCSPPAAPRAPTTSAWRPSASSPAPGSPSTTACRVEGSDWLYARRGRQPPRAPHPPGQVPGPDRGRGDRRPRPGRAAAGRRPLGRARGDRRPRRRAAGRLHRPRGGVGRPDRWPRPSGRATGSAAVDYDIAQVAGAGAVRRRLPRPRPDGRRPRPRGPPRASPSSARASASCCTRRRSPSRARSRSTGCGTRSRPTRR